MEKRRDSAVKREGTEKILNMVVKVTATVISVIATVVSITAEILGGIIRKK